jgi:hypothetical protein
MDDAVANIVDCAKKFVIYKFQPEHLLASKRNTNSMQAHLGKIRLLTSRARYPTRSRRWLHIQEALAGPSCTRASSRRSRRVCGTAALRPLGGR